MTADTQRILLLNTTNHFVRLAYPYAFVQVSEVARRYGIEVRRVDLHGIPGPQREAVLRRHIQQWAPALVGVTLRNTDSLLSTDYTRRSSISSDGSAVRLNLLEQMTQGLPPYYPVHDTRQLISQVRALTSAPIMVGGFGFSVQPQRSLEFLQADFGVIGDPDPVLARLDDVLARRSLETIDNLCWFDEGRVRANPSVFLGPSPNREWVDELVLDRNQFFGAVANNVPATARSIPIEVMRGCPHSCTFCSEPLVKGKRAQLRDLDVVEDELEFLRTHGHNLVWFICSEINAMGNAFALELAERVIRINERRPPSERVRWFTYYLLRFSLDELRTLRRSGFLGGWNDIPAFDDATLKRLRVPYRTRHLVRSIKDVITIGDEESALSKVPRPSLAERILFDPEHRRTLLPEDMLTSPAITLFLGNQATTVETVRETLEVIDRERLAPHFDAAFVIRAERTFDYNSTTAVDARAIRTFSPPSAPPSPSIDPRFRQSAALIQQLGSAAALEDFFTYVEDTFVSQNHLFRKEWCWFVTNTLSLEAFHALWIDALTTAPVIAEYTQIAPVRALLEKLASEPAFEKTRSVLLPEAAIRPLAQAAVETAIRIILRTLPGARRRLFEWLAVTTDECGEPALSSYRLTCRLYERFSQTDELRQEATRELGIEPNSLEQLAFEDFLYRNNIQLRPAYRPFFVPERASSEPRAAE